MPHPFRSFGKHITQIPTQLTLLRLLLVPVLYVLAYMQMRTEFTLLFVLAGLTDLLDGFLARLLHQESAFGAWFDSLSDIFYENSILIWFALLFFDFFILHLGWFIAVFCSLIMIEIFAFVRTRRIVELHTYLLKAASFGAVSMFAYFLIFGENYILFLAAAVLILFSHLDAILIYGFKKHIRPNMRCFLCD